MVQGIIYILCLAMWWSMTMIMMSDVASASKDINWWQRVVLFIVVIWGAPFMLVAQGVQLILDDLLPEGWNDDDRFKY